MKTCGNFGPATTYNCTDSQQLSSTKSNNKQRFYTYFLLIIILFCNLAILLLTGKDLLQFTHVPVFSQYSQEVSEATVIYKVELWVRVCSTMVGFLQ